MIKGLAHVCFIVRKLQIGQDFYEHKLGFKPVFDFIDDKGKKFGVYLHAGERIFVELFEGDHDGPVDRQSFRHVCLEVDDLAATVAQLKDKGIKVTDPALGTDHSWQAWLADPDGNKIELHQYTPESKQMKALGR
jgi:lactoylglutathione lyase